MQEPPVKLEKLKMAAGFVIVATAVAIMFPGLLSMAMGVGRIITFIVVAILVCLGMVYSYRQVTKLSGRGGSMAPEEGITSAAAVSDSASSTASAIEDSTPSKSNSDIQSFEAQP